MLLKKEPAARHSVVVAIVLLVAVVALPALAGEFSDPEPVEIVGYRGHAMEPFIARDGRYLLFNNLNDPSENTDLHWAERISPTSFRYGGKIEGVNTKALEGVPTLDRSGTLYFQKHFQNLWRAPCTMEIDHHIAPGWLEVAEHRNFAAYALEIVERPWNAGRRSNREIV